MECYASKKKLLGLLMLTIIMVGGSIYCATLDDPLSMVIGWAGAAFFGLALFVIAARFLRRGPTLIIDHRGIEDRRLGIGIILWEDIASLHAVESANFVRVEVLDPEKYVPWMPWWTRLGAMANQRVGFSPLNIGFVELEPGMEETWSYIQYRWQMQLRKRRDGNQ